MGKNTVDVTDATFDSDVLKSGKTVVVDFWAEWCGPCKMIAPVLEEIAEEYDGRLRVLKLNVDDNPQTARRFDVMSIPTLILFQDGQPKKRVVGAKGKNALLADLAEFVS
jgi:thioredoxin 1